jgi:hypothetical protein
MKYNNDHDTNGRLLVLLLTPSWLSGSIAVLSALVLSVGTLIIVRYQSSSIRLDYLSYQASHISHVDQELGNQVLTNSFIANLPLLVFWSLVGMVVYLFVSNIFAAIGSTAEFNEELNYVHADRRHLLHQAFEHLAIRLAVLAVWAVYLLLFFHQILPYCIAASLVGSAYFSFWQSASYLGLAMGVMMLAIHLHTILLRLLLFRPRVLSGPLYADVEEIGWHDHDSDGSDT